MQKLLSGLILAWACCATFTHATPLPLARDLAAVAKAAQQQRVPVFVAFTTKHCPYCNTARREYWVPMNSSEHWRSRVIMIEVVLDGPQPFRDFEGRHTTVREFAGRFGVRGVPTVIVFDATGAQATMPIVGLASRDFYGVYMERAVEAGLARVH